MLSSKSGSWPKINENTSFADFMETKKYAYAAFWAGVAVGVSNLVSGIAVGVIGSITVNVDAAQSGTFVRMLIIEIFAGALGLFGLIVAIFLASFAGGK